MCRRLRAPTGPCLLVSCWAVLAGGAPAPASTPAVVAPAAKLVAKATPATHRLIGYFDAKSQKELPLRAVPLANLTHVVLTNAVKVDNQGGLHLRENQSASELHASELIKRLAGAPVKLIVSLRGEIDDVALDELAEVDAVRTRFATDMARRMREWGADGLEIEWHSDDVNGGKALTAPFDVMEQYHFALLCRDLAGTLHAAGNKTLSVAVRPGRQEFSEGSFVQTYIDWLTLRAYSMRSLGDPHHASLKDMRTAIHEWEVKGVPRHQLVLGTPLFGRPGAALHRANDRNEALRLPWREVAVGSLRAPHGDRRGDVFLDAETGKVWWVSGLNTTRAKAAHILDSGYGGLAFRELHQDMPPGPLSLLQAASEAFREHLMAKRRKNVLASPLSLFQRGLTRSRTDGAERRDEF